MLHTTLPVLTLQDLAIEPETGLLHESSIRLLEDWYETVRPVLEAAEKVTKGFLLELEQTAKYEVAFTKTRIKERASLIEKVQGLLVDNKFKGTGDLDLLEIINDLVGGRAVFYFEPDRRLGFDFFHEDPRFHIEKVTLYEALHAESHLHHPSAASLIQRIRTSRNAFESFGPSVSHNGYESLHLVVKLEDDLLPEGIVSAKGGRSFRRSIGSIRIEIQLRSVLQDLWAQPEHGFSYDTRKSKHRAGLAAAEIGIYDDDFHTHKLLVKALERFHSSIWKTYRYSQVRVPLLKQVSSTLGPRIREAGLPPHESEELYRLDRELGLNRDPMELFRDLDIVFDRIDRQGDRRHSLWSLKLPRTPSEWLRQRILLLFLGYLVSIRSEDELVDVISKKIRKVDPSASSQPYDLARQIYMLLKKGDAWFSQHLTSDAEHSVGRDPLVGYRLAGVFLLVSPPSYHRGKEALFEAVGHYEAGVGSRSLSRTGDPILNSAHLRRRLAKFGWYLFLSRDPRRQHLEESSRNLRLAFSTDDLPKDLDLAARERSKTLYDIMTVEFYRTVFARPDGWVGPTGDGTATRFDEELEAEVRGDFLRATHFVASSIETHLSQFRDPQERLGFSTTLGSHGHQALAIWKWAQGDLELARGAIVKSRALLRNADERPLVRDVIRRVESFLVVRRPEEGLGSSDER